MEEKRSFEARDETFECEEKNNAVNGDIYLFIFTPTMNGEL